jgi:hypothetical protein
MKWPSLGQLREEETYGSIKEREQFESQEDE